MARAESSGSGGGGRLLAEDRAQIGDLISRYAWAVDHRDLEMLTALFTDDATMTFEVPSNGMKGFHSGLPAIAGSFKKAWTAPGDLRRHLMSNTWFEETADASCIAVSYLTVVAADDQGLRTVTTGTYRDRLVKQDGWRFKDRHLVLHTGHQLTSAFRT